MKLQLRRITFGLLIVVIFSCVSRYKQERFDKFDFTQFEQHRADSILRTLNGEEYLDFFIEVVNNAHSNINEVDQWLVNQVSLIQSMCQREKPERLFQLAKSLYYARLPNAGFIFTKQIEFASQITESRSLHGAAFANYLTHYAEQYNTDSLAFYLEQFRPIAQTDTSNWLNIVFYEVNGYYHLLSGNYFDAIINYIQILERIPEENTREKSVVYHNLANVYLKLEWFEKAQKYIDLAIEEEGIENVHVANLNTAAIIFSKNGNFERAEKLLSLIVFSSGDYSPAMLAMTYSNYGNLFRKMKRFDDALIYMSKSDSICHAAGLEIGQLINQVNRAELYLDQNENQLALAEIDGLQNVISNYKNPDIEISLHELLYRIYDALGNENMANLHYRKYKDKREQFIGNIPSNLIAEWELSLEREKALELQRSFEVKTASRNRTFYFLLFIFTLVISVLIVILFFINRRSLKIKNKLILAQQKNAHEVELKSKELIAESIKNVTIKTVKEGIYKEVKLILNKLPEENRIHFSKFLIDIKSSGEDVVLEEFDKRFIGVYDNFYEQLQQRAIDLTPIELRVCALIRLNCSTKEIALLMNRSIGRIENIRISIRKKLGLSKDENLQQFLLRI